MKRTVQIYIEGERLDLFDDETISVNSSIQTIKDISKTFNDFSQSFSVPASDQNNIIFQHFYNSEVILRNNTFIDFQEKRTARIEIDGILFRNGKIALEKANLKDAMPSSYQITFYGELTALKDNFGERMMSELDWTAYNHTYTYDEIKDRVTDGATDYDVRYPLISSARYWQYDNPALPNENIDTPLGAISWLELFPALKLRRVLENFEAEFDIEFLGGWITDDRFDKHFGLFKNTNTFSYSTPAQKLDLTATFNANYQPIVSQYVDITTDTINFQYIQFPGIFDPNQLIDVGYWRLRATVSNVSDPSVSYYFDLYNNGTLESSGTGVGNATTELFNIDNTNNSSLDKSYCIEFRTDAPLTADIDMTFEFYWNEPPIGYLPIEFVNIDVASVSTSSLQNLAVNAPEISVAKYFSNILKQFNLTCYGVGDNKYVLETIEQWYLTGRIIDITEHTEPTNIEVDRITLYKKIEFKYKECKSLVNRFFASTFSREYGDLMAVYDYEGGDFKIELDFENILFSKFDDIPLQVAYCLDENLNPYTPNPIIVSIYPEQSVDFYLTDETTPEQVNSYVPFGQDSLVGSDDFSLNWGVEISSLLEGTITNGLYNQYYSAYINNLYNFRNRLVKVKCKLPVSILTDLALNDRLVIRDKRYLIDTFTTDLSTGVTTFELLLDFRDLLAIGTGGGPVKPIIPPISVPNQPNLPQYPGCIDIYIPFIKGCTGANISECTIPLVGVTIDPISITEPGYVEICLPDNPNPVRPVVREKKLGPNDVYLISENGLHLQNEYGNDRQIRICVEYICPGGNVVSVITITQQGNILSP